jgi:hypothetical protein
MLHIGIKILQLTAGGCTAFDGKWLAEYDPTRPGIDPNGNPMRAHIVVTDDPAKAMQFTDALDAHAVWTTESGSTEPGRDRPLTAFTVALEPIPPAARTAPSGPPRAS